MVFWSRCGSDPLVLALGCGAEKLSGSWVLNRQSVLKIDSPRVCLWLILHTIVVLWFPVLFTVPRIQTTSYTTWSSAVSRLFCFSSLCFCNKSKTESKDAKLHFLSLQNQQKSIFAVVLFELIQSARKSVSQPPSVSSFSGAPNACTLPFSTRGRQFPNLHRVALNHSSKKINSYKLNVQTFCCYKCLDPWPWPWPWPFWPQLQLSPSPSNPPPMSTGTVGNQQLLF